MNAIMSNISENVLKRCISESAESGNDPARIIKNNADVIKNESMMVYCLYECMHGFGFKKYSPAEVKSLAFKIASGK